MRVMSSCYFTPGLPGLPRSSYQWVTIRKTRDISKRRRRVPVTEVRAAHDPTRRSGS